MSTEKNASTQYRRRIRRQVRTEDLNLAFMADVNIALGQGGRGSVSSATSTQLAPVTQRTTPKKAKNPDH